MGKLANRMIGPFLPWKRPTPWLLLFVLCQQPIFPDSTEYTFEWIQGRENRNLFSSFQEDSFYRFDASPVILKETRGTVLNSGFLIRNRYGKDRNSAILLDIYLFPGGNRSILAPGRNQFHTSGWINGGVFYGSFLSTTEKSRGFRLLFEKSLVDESATFRLGPALFHRDLQQEFSGGSLDDRGNLGWIHSEDSLRYRESYLETGIHFEMETKFDRYFKTRSEISWLPFGIGQFQQHSGSLDRQSGNTTWTLESYDGKGVHSDLFASQHFLIQPVRNMILSIGMEYAKRDQTRGDIRFQGTGFDFATNAPLAIQESHLLEYWSDLKILKKTRSRSEIRGVFRLTRRSGFFVEQENLEGYESNLKLADGSVYTGVTENGLFHGNGRLLYPDGSEYRGEWIFGKRDGFGVFRTKDGARYEGFWRNDVREGKGILHFPDGSVFRGIFRNNTFDGPGVLELTDGDRIEGFWQDGVLLEESGDSREQYKEEKDSFGPTGSETE